MHENFVESFKALDQKYRTNTEGFKPYYMLYLAWAAFWEIRATKPRENPITHVDIKAYMETMNVDLSPSEVKVILRLDNSYYNSIKKHDV